MTGRMEICLISTSKSSSSSRGPGSPCQANMLKSNCSSSAPKFTRCFFQTLIKPFCRAPRASVTMPALTALLLLGTWMWALLAQGAWKGQGALRGWILHCAGHPPDTAAAVKAPGQNLEVELEAFPGQKSPESSRAEPELVLLPPGRAHSTSLPSCSLAPAERSHTGTARAFNVILGKN